MSYHLDPDNDPNEAYALIPMPPELRGPPEWWAMTRNGVPLRHCPPQVHDLAEQAQFIYWQSLRW
jgi:hypothetical protein